jgi:hypothetical protein
MNEPAQTQIGATQPATAKETYINLKGALQAIWEQFRETFPNAADAFAERLLALLEREPTLLGAAADVNVGMPDVLVPKSVVEKSLQGMWEDFCEAYPEAAEALAKTLVTHHDPEATDDWFSWTKQVMIAIPDILEKFAQPADPAPTSSDNQGPSHSDEVAIATDTEEALSDDAASQQPATDDDQDASQEQVAIASHPEDAPADDAAMTETAKAHVEVDPTSGDQAGAQVATSAPIVPDEGFSFSMFAKPGIPLEVAKQALPAEQASPADESSGAGMPGSESAHPDVGSEDVGNAAPNKEHVVHHGDLAP